MELEDLKATARREGRDDSTVTLPRESFVSYRSSSPTSISADEVTKRAISRAEAKALRLDRKGMTMMDLSSARGMEADDYLDGAGSLLSDVPAGESIRFSDEPSPGSLVHTRPLLVDEQAVHVSETPLLRFTCVDELD